MPLLGMCYLRRKFAKQFGDFTGTDRIYNGDTEAFQFEDISAGDVKLLFLKQMYKSLLFYDT